jgi:Helix-loop-helix DNA-binding domain
MIPNVYVIHVKDRNSLNVLQLSRDRMKAIRRMRHNNKEKERKDRIKIDYQEIRSLLPESYFSDKKQVWHLIHLFRVFGFANCWIKKPDLSGGLRILAYCSSLCPLACYLSWLHVCSAISPCNLNGGMVGIRLCSII